MSAGSTITGSGTWDGMPFTVQCAGMGIGANNLFMGQTKEAICQMGNAANTFTGPVNQVNLYFNNLGAGTYVYMGPTATPAVNDSYVAITGTGFQQNATTRPNFVSGMLVLDEVTPTRARGSFSGTWDAGGPRPAATAMLTFDVTYPAP